MFDPVATSIGYLRAGKLRPLGVTSARRVSVLPDVPTIGEFVPGYDNPADLSERRMAHQRRVATLTCASS
jgi:Tripartite tricarboxylate transporter family receptor